MQNICFKYEGHDGFILIPDNFNGRWIWKTEFFTAFDQAERALFDRGYARVYYGISDMYGCDKAVRLMHAFHLYIAKEYGLSSKPYLFGFSRGALYAFNYALYYPDACEKLYLDAPVLNLRSWPKDEKEHAEVLYHYNLSEETFESCRFSPIEFLDEFSKNGIPVLIVAGDSDRVVPHTENAQIMVDYYRSHGPPIDYILKPGCDHHPHSLDDVTPIIEFIER